MKMQRKKKEFRVNTIILTKVKSKSINDVAITNRASNNLRCNEIRVCAEYVCDESNDEI